MKRLFALLALGAACNSALAATGTGILTLEGTVSSGGTCPIEVVTPGGPGLKKIFLGDFMTKDFTAPGQKTAPVRFALRHDPATCTVTPGAKATVKYSAVYGADPSGKLYALQTGVGYSTGLALAIFDKSNAQLDPDATSVEYDLSDTAPTDMNFTTLLESTSATVTEGQIFTSVNFVVDIP